MKFLDLIRQNHSNPASLETLYRQALHQHTAEEFASDIQAVRSEAPENLLYAAWFYRLQEVVSEARVILWQFALPLAVLCGLVLWALSDDSVFRFVDRIPLFMVVAFPLAGVCALGYLALSEQLHYRRAMILTGVLVLFTIYPLLVVPRISSWQQGPAADLVTLHLPLLAWATVGIFLTGMKSTAQNRFTFVIKSLEVVTTGGLFAVAIGIFFAVTMGLFQALNIDVPDVVQRLLIAGIGGMVPVLAVAIVYNPMRSPYKQDFSQGLSKFLANLLRMMIIPTLVVAVTYVVFIPFNFMQPFNNRDVLFIYNGMLFAVIALLVGATPVHQEELSQNLQTWLRRAILMVASLAVLVSLYALAAILYRTWMDTLTMNRLVIIGWNTINIVVLSWMIYQQFRHKDEEWALASKKAYNLAAVAYTAWAAFIIIFIPLIFR